MHPELLDIVDRFTDRRVLLVGDFMLDRTVIGHVERSSPAAGAPVLRAIEQQDNPGGAGFVALSVRALGARVSCFGLLGRDQCGDRVEQLLAEAGAQIGGLLRVEHRCTTTKTRFKRRVSEATDAAQSEARAEQLLRVDEEDLTEISAEHAERLIARFHDALPSADVVALQDYAKGALSAPICRALIKAAREVGVPVVVDPARTGGWDKYAGATLLKPNRAELDNGAGRAIPDSELDGTCAALVDRLHLEAILVTLADRGARLLTREGSACDVPAAVRDPVDPVGAGDVVLAVLAVAIAAGASLDQASVLANLAGGLEVTREGCVPVTAPEIRAALKRHHP